MKPVIKRIFSEVLAYTLTVGVFFLILGISSYFLHKNTEFLSVCIALYIVLLPFIILKGYIGYLEEKRGGPE